MEKERAHFSWVWQMRHSQALSMWVWPTTVTLTSFSTGARVFSMRATASPQEREKASRLTPLVSTKSQALAARFKMRGLSGLSSGRTLWASSRQVSQ